MPRPRKNRRVCSFPQTVAFSPAGDEPAEKEIVMTVDEYETVRLIDREGFSQEECGKYMNIARTTVQMIYVSARKKLADMLVEGAGLRIEGGDYRLCNGRDCFCGQRDCFMKKYHEEYGKEKGEYEMRIAVTYEKGQIFQHFGHTEQFKVYDIEDGKVVSSRIVDTNGSGHGALAGVLTALGADALICGGIGGGARNALEAAGIRLYGGVTGEADKAAEALAEGRLEFNPDAQCSHHGEHHHGEGHHGGHSCDGHHSGECGSHGCGGHHGGR